MDNENVLISNNIRRLRFFANEMTQQELSDKTGVTRQTIVAIENGKYFPSLELGIPDCTHLQCSIVRCIYIQP